MQVAGRGGMLSYEELKEAEGLGDMEELDAMLEDGPPGPMDLEEANAQFFQMLAANGLLEEGLAEGGEEEGQEQEEEEEEDD